jgi:hypothetical protein
VEFSCTFRNASTDCGFREQAKVRGRASLVNVAGRPGVRLHTKPGDNNVAGSGASERNDLTLSQAESDGYEGREHWWAHSIMLPGDFVIPPAGAEWHWYVLADFHDTRNRGGQANFHVLVQPDGQLRFVGYGGPNVPTGPGTPGYESRFEAVIGPVVRNVWYDFVYHVKWSSGSDGFFNAWVNGVRKLAHRGPTLYTGYGVYLKLANYHSAFGQPSSVIHSRVLRGTTPAAVSLIPLEGALP